MVNIAGMRVFAPDKAPIQILIVFEKRTAIIPSVLWSSVSYMIALLVLGYADFKEKLKTDL